MTPILLALLLSPDEIVYRVYDASGRPSSEARTVAEGGSRTVSIRNLNGREVPLESVEERAVADGIVERTIRRYDPNGNPGPVERVRIETRKAETITTLHRADVNGKLALIERTTAVTRGSETVETVERPEASGGLRVAERRETTKREAGETTVVQRPDLNGRLYEAARTSVERAGNTENRAEYDAITGQMRLVRQIVTRTDGDRTEVEVFTPTQLLQRQIVEKTRTGGGVTSVVSVQLPDAYGRLSTPRVVEETTCRGQCR